MQTDLTQRPSTSTIENIKASDIMTRSVFSAHDDWSITDLALFLTRNGISGAPVVNEHGEILGVVSAMDIARHTSMAEKESMKMDQMEFQADDISLSLDIDFADEENNSRWEGTKVHEIMTPSLFSVEASDTSDDVIKAMLTNRIHRVFVCDNDKVIGVISALDILNIISR